jgi:lipopolysaccharide export LptBFGC system permease protein LptF
MITIFILAHWIVANAIALMATAFAFSRFGRGGMGLLLSITAVAYGIWLTVGQGFPSEGIVPIHVLSWLPFGLGLLALGRWIALRFAGD